MSVKGTVRGNVIELDEPLPFADGTRVEVTVAPEENVPRRNSPQAWLQLVGTLSHEEAEAIRQAVQDIRRIDQEMWEEQEEEVSKDSVKVTLANEQERKGDEIPA